MSLSCGGKHALCRHVWCTASPCTSHSEPGSQATAALQYLPLPANLALEWVKKGDAVQHTPVYLSFAIIGTGWHHTKMEAHAESRAPISPVHRPAFALKNPFAQFGVPLPEALHDPTGTAMIRVGHCQATRQE